MSTQSVVDRASINAKLIYNKTFADECKRMKYAMDMHAVAGSRGWVVFKLEDASPVNHTVYERRQDAVADMKWDRDNYFYLQIQPDGMPDLVEAGAVIEWQRFVVGTLGHRIPDPEWDYPVELVPSQAWDQRSMARQLKSGIPLDQTGLGWTNLPIERFN